MILFGKPVAEKIYANLVKEIATKKLKPFLAVILVGEDAASLSFIRAKEKVARSHGIGFRLYQFPEIASEGEILELINNLNRNDYISGIVVQLPLPKKMSADKIINKISPDKDVDGFLGKFGAPTALAILEILNFYKINYRDKKIVILGHGKLVGTPLDKLFQEMEIHAEIIDRQTQDIAAKTCVADIIISATGEPGLITSEMVKKETIIIDAGTAEANGKISGDISQDVYEKVNSYTPVPGGVGPVTVSCLMKNLVEATEK